MWFAFFLVALVVIVVQGAEMVRLRRRAKNPWRTAWEDFARRQGIRP